MDSSVLQSSLFEEDYLLRELGQVAHVPQVALTELVANAWDAGATSVDLTLPDEIGNTLTIIDNGHGMTANQFKRRWMTLRYNRLKNQGEKVEFPEGKKLRPRKAFGRNGVGRHGLLCFANEYKVETWRDGKFSTFVVATASGESPFVLKSELFGERIGNGTKLSVQIERKIPDANEILTVLTTRFLHDPEFIITVNSKKLNFSEIENKVKTQVIKIDEKHSATIIVIDSTRQNQSSLHQGIAFWVMKRLVGDPSWVVGDVANFDGRTRFAKRYKIIVDTEGFENDVEQDWTRFKKNEKVKELFKKTADCIKVIAKELASEIVEESSFDALSENKRELGSLGIGAQSEVAEFTRQVAQEHPTISLDILSTAVAAIINIEKSKSGSLLLQKLSLLTSEDIDGLNKLLDEWTIKDALKVLDEIDNRISVIETIQRLSSDPDTDELHTLHPLILRSRWIFGPEYESFEYCSNVTLKTIATKLFGKKSAEFLNEKDRPDIIVLPDHTSIQLLGVQCFDSEDTSIIKMQNILLIELKKGGFPISRNETYQAEEYVQDIVGSGVITGSPFINAWVVGHQIKEGVVRDKTLQHPEATKGYGRVRTITFAALIDTAKARLLKLRDTLANRYNNIPTDKLLDKVFEDRKIHQHTILLEQK